MAKIVGFADVWEKWIKEQNCNADEFIPMSFRARISNDALKTNKQTNKNAIHPVSLEGGNRDMGDGAFLQFLVAS